MFATASGRVSSLAAISDPFLNDTHRQWLEAHGAATHVATYTWQRKKFYRNRSIAASIDLFLHRYARTIYSAGSASGETYFL